MKNETTSTGNYDVLYAVYAQNTHNGDARLVLKKVFAIEAEAEDFAETLRELTYEEGDYEGEDLEPEYALVKVERWGRN